MARLVMHQRPNRLAALHLGLLALSSSYLAPLVLARGHVNINGDAGIVDGPISLQKTNKNDGHGRHHQHQPRARHRLGAQKIKLEPHQGAKEADADAVAEADEEFWARMLQMVDGSLPPGNQPPVATVIRVTTVSTSTVSDNVLRNDSDPDGDPISVIMVEDTTINGETTITLDSGAVVTMQPDGDFVYDPNGAYDSLIGEAEATDTFTYTIADPQGATDSAPVVVTITASNLPPVANDNFYTIQADQILRGQNVLSNDFDPNGDPIEITFIDDTPLNGEPVTVDLSSGAEITIRPATPFIYRPGDAFDYLREGETANDIFEYTIADPFGETDTATVTITVVGVASPPTANDVSIQTESQGEAEGNVCSNDVDPEGGDLTVSFVDGTAINGVTEVPLDSGATVTMTSDCSFIYDPNGAFDDLPEGSTASDQFSYTITDDQGLTDSANVFVTITGSANEPPVANDDTFTTANDDTVVGNVLVNDSDPEGQPIEVTMVDSTIVDGPTDIVLDSGALVAMSPDGEFEYDPNGQFDDLGAGQTAEDTFVYTIEDPAGAMDSATVFITIVGSVRPTPSPTPRPPTPSPPTLSPPTPRPPTPSPTTAFPTTTPTFNPTLPCNLSPQERREQLTLMAIRVSGPTPPVTVGTPQYNALEWLIDQDALYVCPQDKKSVQRYTVAVFYFSTNGPNWKECSAPDDLNDPASIEAANDACDLTITPPPLGTDIIPRVSGTDAWLTPANECFWGGLECNADNLCLDRIEFENNTLAGTIPTEVEQLEDLRFFYTERGNLDGTIPSEFGTLSGLIVFDVDFNKLSGSIPSSFFGLREILQFDLNNNTLTGTLSTEIGQMTTLRFLQVGGNPLRGTIPTELGNLDLLIVGGFEYSDLTGTMPQEICDNRVPPIGDGFIRSLISDCRGPNAQLECSCCTECKR